jgi:hypothetical protein
MFAVDLSVDTTGLHQARLKAAALMSEADKHRSVIKRSRALKQRFSCHYARLLPSLGDAPRPGEEAYLGLDEVVYLVDIPNDDDAAWSIVPPDCWEIPNCSQGRQA